MMRDRFGREIRSLRFSVTQKCNLACFYCHREGQEQGEDEANVEEFEKIVRGASKLDIKKVKLTGGEPLLRRDVIKLIQKVSPYLDEVSLTTNGVLLAKYAESLKESGLARVNVSLDSLRARNYARITGKNFLPQVLRGIKCAVENKLTPVKLNMVLLRGVNEHEVPELIDFAYANSVVLQLIEFEQGKEAQNRSEYQKYHLDLNVLEKRLARDAKRVVIRKLQHRKKYFVRWKDGVVEVEVVRPMHNSEFCMNCTRLRVTSDGKLKPCLYDTNCVDILGLIRNHISEEAMEEALKEAILRRRPYWVGKCLQE